MLLRLLGEDKRQVLICGEVAGFLVEGLARADWEESGQAGEHG